MWIARKVRRAVDITRRCVRRITGCAVAATTGTIARACVLVFMFQFWMTASLQSKMARLHQQITPASGSEINVLGMSYQGMQTRESHFVSNMMNRTVTWIVSTVMWVLLPVVSAYCAAWAAFHAYPTGPPTPPGDTHIYWKYKRVIQTVVAGSGGFILAGLMLTVWWAQMDRFAQNIALDLFGTAVAKNKLSIEYTGVVIRANERLREWFEAVVLSAVIPISTGIFDCYAYFIGSASEPSYLYMAEETIVHAFVYDIVIEWAVVLAFQATWFAVKYVMQSIQHRSVIAANPNFSKTLEDIKN